MKMLKFLLCMFLIGMILPDFAVNAQEVNPPGPDQIGELDPETPPNRVIKPFDGFINIDQSTSINNKQPTIIHGDDHYLVGYVKENPITGFDEIWVKVFDNHGNEIRGGPASSNQGFCSNVSIAYESQTGYFIVTYQCYEPATGWDIIARAFSPEGPVQDARMIAASTKDETKPSVACNTRTGNCLIAYEYDLDILGFPQHPIQGRFLYVDSTGIQSWSGTQISLDLGSGKNPHLAWGMDTERFLLSYSWWYVIGSEWYPVYTHLYDVFTAPNQYAYPSFYIDYPGVFTGNNAKEPLAVTYDPCTQKFLLLFYYESTPNNSDLWIAILNQNTSGTISLEAIANTDLNESSGEIRFITDDHEPAMCGINDRVIVTYRKDEYGIFAVDIKGNSNSINPEYSWDASDYIMVAVDFSDLDGLDPVIASGRQGRMFVAWEDYYSDANNKDVIGRMIQVIWKNYIPMAIK